MNSGQHQIVRKCDKSHFAIERDAKCGHFSHDDVRPDQ